MGVTSLSGIRVTADAGYNGPDFKLLARTGSANYQIPAKKVPEPSTIAALGLLAVSAV
ncbi:MAG: PEP-CTERM sorting domain-containing protein [Aulosira sp. DedQUE10]|nr:PEP-CTERM sorting domain-containing protein [Aulosira sp. DedQUE10]